MENTFVLSTHVARFLKMCLVRMNGFFCIFFIILFKKLYKKLKIGLHRIAQLCPKQTGESKFTPSLKLFELLSFTSAFFLHIFSSLL